MLDAIRGVVETMKYIMRQEEFQAGDLEALAGKIYNPGSEDPFDFNNLWPAGIMNDAFMEFTNNGFTPWTAHAQTQGVSLDKSLDKDIPLDSSDVYAEIDIIADFAFKDSADIYVGFERFYEINHEILQVILRLKKM